MFRLLQLRRTFVKSILGLESIIIIWDITPCSPIGVDRRFGGTYSPLLQLSRVSQQDASNSDVYVCIGYVAVLTFSADRMR
jgi:hypothetical protein